MTALVTSSMDSRSDSTTFLWKVKVLRSFMIATSIKMTRSTNVTEGVVVLYRCSYVGMRGAGALCMMGKLFESTTWGAGLGLRLVPFSGVMAIY